MDATTSDRLEYYLNKLRTADAQAAAAICVECTADPQLHVFSELLATPQISSLQNTVHQNGLRLLQLFAHGTMSDYKRSVADLPPLSDAHLRKLRRLTLVTVADGCNSLSYDELRTHLQLSSDADVEQVVVDALYAGLLRARMNQSLRSVEVTATVGRDVVMPHGAQRMVHLLRAWTQSASTLVNEIDEKIQFIGSETRRADETKALASAKMDALRRRATPFAEQNGMDDDIMPLASEQSSPHATQSQQRRAARARSLRASLRLDI